MARADNLVKAVNKTITYLMKEDENNRVAVVAYNTKATKILPLGRYYVGSKADYSNTNSYFSVSKSSKNDGYKKLDIGKIKTKVQTILQIRHRNQLRYMGQHTFRME